MTSRSLSPYPFCCAECARMSLRPQLRKSDSLFHKALRYTPFYFISKGLSAFMSLKTAREMDIETDKIAGEGFPTLEEKIYKAIELLKSAREGKAAAERDANRLREQLEQREEELEVLRAEMVTLRKEREDVRSRVEKMVKQIDSLVSES